MQKVSLQSNPFQTYWWVSIVLLMLVMSIISIDITTAQTKPSDSKPKFRVNGKEITHTERSTDEAKMMCNQELNRTIDGTCNNVSNVATSLWGASDIGLFREMPSSYGAPDFYNEMGGNCRMSARAISNLVCDQSEDILSPRGLGSLVFTWGQFIDHDIDLTPEGHTEYVPIILPSNEPLFASPIPFFRSEPYPNSGITYARQQRNLITSWLDASQVYGAEDSRAAWLRTFTGGKLKTSQGDLLPYNTIDGELGSDIDPTAPSMAGDNDGTNVVFVAGDVRANEQPGLTSLHTLFVREHNRICEQLAEQGQNNDEQLYQRARKIVGAMIQSITYNHFLPALGIDISHYSGYDNQVRPDISNIFATAAYRFGHTMVTNEIPLVGVDCQSGESLALLDGFFNPSVVADNGIEPFLAGLASQTQQKIDAKIVDNLRNFLFPSVGGGPAFGLDLASLNIQRGRDHGLPDYNSVRVHYTGFAASDFSDITSDAVLQTALERAYGSVYEIDLWVGLLCEDQLNGSSVGVTMNAILGKQFENIRDADFYFYLNDPAFSGQQRDQLETTTLGDIIKRNSPISDLQNNVFFAADCMVSSGGDGSGGDGSGGGGNGGGRFLSTMSNQLSVFPNPSTGRVNLKMFVEKDSTEAIIRVQGLDGKDLIQNKVAIYDHTLLKELDLQNLSSGMYFISVQVGDTFYSDKIVIEK